MINNNLILKSLQEESFKAATVASIPEGYIELNLSTKGLVGAPAVLHVRNFKISEILVLSTTLTSDIPLVLINILNDMIYEDVDVGNWHEKEVEELMLYIFHIFFKDLLTDIAFPVTDEDIEYMKNLPAGEETLKNYYEGKYIPRTDILISRDTSTYDIPSNFNPNIKITNKKTGFHVTFGYQKYKDQVVLKRWISEFFKESDSQYKDIADQIRYNEEVRKKAVNDIEALRNLLPIDSEKEYKYKLYLIEKMKTTTDVIKIASIIDYNGVDTSKLSISDKYKLMSQDARIDHGMMSKLNKRQKKICLGLKPEVEMTNPFTGQKCLRRFSFRIPSILQALPLLGDDDYDDGYDEVD